MNIRIITTSGKIREFVNIKCFVLVNGTYYLWLNDSKRIIYAKNSISSFSIINTIH